MRASWKGFITLGQLGIPVRLYSATQTIQPRFTQVHEKDGSPVERVLVCRAEDKEITYDETLRAVEYEPGRYITFTTRELAKASEDQAKSVDIKQFSEVGTIDTIYFEKPYYITPAKGGERAYSLLREALQRTNTLAIAQFVIHNKERIAVLAPRQDVLMLYQLRFTGEIVPRSHIKTPALPRPSPAELEALTNLIERFSGPVHIEDYHDEQSERIAELVERKIRGLPAPRPEASLPEATPEDELLPTLRDTLKSR